MGNKRRSGPRIGSAAHRAMCLLVDLGGRAKIGRLLDVIPVEYHPTHMLERCVIGPLAEYSLILEEGEYLSATPKGKDYAGQHLVMHLPVTQKYVGQIVPGRVPVKPRPLNLAKHRATAPFRPGSDDHLKIPSLMGNTRKLPSGEVVE